MDDGSINAATGSDVVNVLAVAPNPNAVEHHPKRGAIKNQGPPGKRRTVNRIVRGWTINDDDNDDDTATVREKAVEPTTAPPPLFTSSTIRLQVFGSIDPQSKWGCDECSDGGFSDLFWRNYSKLVSYDTKHTYRVDIQVLPTWDYFLQTPYESKIHRRIFSVPLVGSKHEQGRCITMTNGEPNEDFFNDLYGRIEAIRKFMEKLVRVDDSTNDPPPQPSVTLIIQSEMAPPVPNGFELSRTSSDDIRPVLQSKSFHDRVSSWCQELNINAKYYTPVFENKSSKEQPFTKNTSNVVQKSAMEWWKEPQYSIDYCFESIIQEIIQEENTALSTTADGHVAAPVSDSVTVVTPSTTTVEERPVVVKGATVKLPSKRRTIAPIAAVARSSHTNRSNKRMRH